MPLCDPSLRLLLPYSFLLLFCSSLARSDDGLQFNFPTFDVANGSYFDGNPNINYNALQLTWDSSQNTSAGVNQSGRITYTKELRLWDPDSNQNASFNTSFLLNMGVIDSNVNTTGGGMAFIICSEKVSESQLSNSYGEFLGIFNQSIIDNINVDTGHQLVAIEFDTFKDSYDPDNDHVGIDLKSTVSIANASLAPLGVHLRNSDYNTSVWIDYDGRGKKLSIFVGAGNIVTKPVQPVLAYPIDLRQYLSSNVYVGFSGSTGTQMETHCVRAWSFSAEGLPSPANLLLIVGLALAGLVVLLALTASFLVVRRRRSRNRALEEWTPDNLIYGPRKFTYKELSKATNNFSTDCLLGEGGFGAVYKGTLADPINSEVAVKRLSTPCMSTQGMREFIAEVTIMGRLRHRNLVPLLGWCQASKGKLLLVYEYMPNGNLSQWLHGAGGESNEAKSVWETRYKVMKGLATGLLYLHEEWEMVVVHRDLKPSNVLLDREFNARLGDFGLARLIKSGDQDGETGTIAGTPGYMAPECVEIGIVTKESDLYSFGIVSMEMATGCRPSSDLRRRLWQLHQENRLSEAADPSLATFHPEEMQRLLLVSLACCHFDPALRPDIRQVLHALSSLSSSLVVHPQPLRTLDFVEFPSSSSWAIDILSNPSTR